jgi:hypothetical protein
MCRNYDPGQGDTVYVINKGLHQGERECEREKTWNCETKARQGRTGYFCHSAAAGSSFDCSWTRVMDAWRQPIACESAGYKRIDRVLIFLKVTWRFDYLSYPVLKSRTEVFIRLLMMFNHKHSNNMINRWNILIKQSNISYIMTQWSEKDYRAENSEIILNVAQLRQTWPLKRLT